MVMDETDVQSPEQGMVQAIHAEWVQELRDVKNELMHVRELVGVLVRREICRKQGGSCGQTTRQDGARADRSR